MVIGPKKAPDLRQGPRPSSTSGMAIDVERRADPREDVGQCGDSEPEGRRDANISVTEAVQGGLFLRGSFAGPTMAEPVSCAIMVQVRRAAERQVRVDEKRRTVDVHCAVNRDRAAGR